MPQELGGAEADCVQLRKAGRACQRGYPHGAALQAFSHNRPSVLPAPRLPPEVSSAQVSSSSNPATVAGAIAGKVREEKPVCTKSLGADSVANAIYSIAFARLYLADDNLVSPPARLALHCALEHRCGAAAVLSCALRAFQDICCLPEFVKEESASGETVSVMKLAIAIQE